MEYVNNTEPHNMCKIIIICFIASLSRLLFGMDTGIISGALPFLKEQFHLNTVTQECIVSAVLMGAFIGTLSSGLISKKLGRKNILILSACIFIIASACCYMANSPVQLILFRLFLGMAAFNLPDNGEHRYPYSTWSEYIFHLFQRLALNAWNPGNTCSFNADRNVFPSQKSPLADS